MHLKRCTGALSYYLATLLTHQHAQKLIHDFILGVAWEIIYTVYTHDIAPRPNLNRDHVVYTPELLARRRARATLCVGIERKKKV